MGIRPPVPFSESYLTQWSFPKDYSRAVSFTTLELAIMCRGLQLAKDHDDWRLQIEFKGLLARWVKGQTLTQIQVDREALISHLIRLTQFPSKFQSDLSQIIAITGESEITVNLTGSQLVLLHHALLTAQDRDHPSHLQALPSINDPSSDTKQIWLTHQVQLCKRLELLLKRV